MHHSSSITGFFSAPMPSMETSTASPAIMGAMPAGVPVGTLAIGKPGAINAALLAAAILANDDAALGDRLRAWREAQTGSVAEAPQ